MLRLFFALQPTLEQRLGIAAQVTPLIAQLPAQRLTPANLHTTLCFIGAVAEERLAALTSAADRIRGQPALLRFDRLEFWPKPRVICAAASDESALGTASDLAERIRLQITAAGFPADAKPFRAHLTVARKADAQHAAQSGLPWMLAPAITFHCDHFVLMRSDPGEVGSTYSVVASWPLDIA